MSLIDALERIFGTDHTGHRSTTSTSKKSAKVRVKRSATEPKLIKQPIELTFGLDFGTAFTKVVIGEQRKSYAIPFQTRKNLANEFLLPCLFSLDAEGVCELGVNKHATRQIGNLKMRLLDGDYGHECIIEIATFLGLVIRQCRNWLLENEASVYRDRLPDWYINVGVPTDSYHDDVLSNVYNDIIILAWNISVTQGPITLELAKSIMDDPKSSESGRDILGNALEPIIHPEKIELFPEFVAQITGYVRSSSRQVDLHALVDIGAGTVDITVFNVYEDVAEGDHLFPIFAKKVEKLGVNYLLNHRIEESDYSGDWRPDVTGNALEDVEIALKLGITQNLLEEIDEILKTKLRTSFVEQLVHTKDVRHPNSQRWKDGVPLFLCGGGSRLNFYSSLFKKLAATLRRYPIVITPLPKPDRLDAINFPEDEFDRLSVAYGLSFSALDIGTIRTTDQVEDVVETKSSGLTMCSRCNGNGGPRGNDCLACGGRGWIN